MSTKTLLAIETSCDETSIALLESTQNELGTTFRTLSHVTLSQADMHAQYGGVYPNMARREHQNNIVALIAEALDKAHILKPRQELAGEPPHLNYLEREEEVRLSLTDFVVSHPRPEIDAIAVTTGPGLEPALWVGVSTARALADYWNLPLVPVNHMEGHIVSVLATSDTFQVPDINLPALALLISGGHTELVRINSIGNYIKLGSTRDDAIGEAFDKVARLMELPYPGGPQISRLAVEYKESGHFDNHMHTEIKLPRPMMHSGDYDFSFSGIKTAVRYLIESLPKPLTPEIKQAIAYEFETAVTEVLVAKTKKALTEEGLLSLIVAGGVAANTHIRAELTNLCQHLGTPIFLPKGVLAMDNALMIAIAGALKLHDSSFVLPDISQISVQGNWSL